MVSILMCTITALSIHMETFVILKPACRQNQKLQSAEDLGAAKCLGTMITAVAVEVEVRCEWTLWQHFRAGCEEDFGVHLCKMRYVVNY